MSGEQIRRRAQWFGRLGMLGMVVCCMAGGTSVPAQLADEQKGASDQLRLRWMDLGQPGQEPAQESPFLASPLLRPALAPGNEATEVAPAGTFQLDLSLTLRQAKPNEVREPGNLSGIFVDHVQDNRFQLINPFAPSGYSFEDNTVRDLFDGKATGLKLFSISF